ncbi:LysR family transcriptional regulator [Ramlibacter albus]|uniref:LysR family transcriptional regulator n=1 Tax=Ramlibacter albus TaxID=2079448 RepID=A0A923MA33_9BURK|nr:LysR family transcriptional regulator [Ramlibacter albus]MBC5766441.1 LysR family transcriptional regulator [Ramlibacter albus]
MAIDLVMAMRVFHAVVDAGSFAGAADRLELSRGMATRYVAQLESHLGVRLLHRTTRSLSLTGAGNEYLQRSAQILTAVDEAERAVAQEAAAPRGLLRLTAPAILAPVLAPAIAGYLKRHPQVEADVQLNDRIVDLVEGGFDLALRIARQVDPGLIARPVMRFSMVAFASPAYLKAHGTPRTPPDLHAHNCIWHPHTPIGNTWHFSRGKESHAIPVKGNMRASSGRMLLDAAVAGLGVCYEPDFLAADMLRARKLVQVLPAWRTIDADLFAVWANRRFMPPKVRAFVDYLVEFSARPSRRP